MRVRIPPPEYGRAPTDFAIGAPTEVALKERTLTRDQVCEQLLEDLEQRAVDAGMAELEKHDDQEEATLEAIAAVGAVLVHEIVRDGSIFSLQLDERLSALEARRGPGTSGEGRRQRGRGERERWGRRRRGERA